MNGRQAFPAEDLIQAGLNRQHVFALADLPETLRAKLGAQARDRQLILLGHGGRALWEAMQAAAPTRSNDPIDDYTRVAVNRCLQRILPPHAYRFLYPGNISIGLQQLGELAGWHHPSPFAIGIDAEWGSWFAYRALVLADSDFPLTPRVDRSNPCVICEHQACISACPGKAAGRPFQLAACIDQRLQTASACAQDCLARQACPVGRQHAYDAAQMAHSYSRSLAMIREWRQATGRTPDSASQPRTTR